MRYLWESFRQGEDFEFHIVAPFFKESHKNLHASGVVSGSIDAYNSVQQAALDIIKTNDANFILHSNGAHYLYKFSECSIPILVQVNDYETATAITSAFSLIFRFRFRRLASLLWRRKHEKKSLLMATKVIFNSEYTRRIVTESYKLDPARTLTIYKSVDVDFYLPPMAMPSDPYPARCSGSRLLFIGSNWYIKGFDRLLDVFKRLSEVFTEVSLVVVGDAGFHGNQNMIEKADIGKVSDRIYFTGLKSKEEIRDLMWHSDIFVLPSRKEALGVSILESMAAGLAVVASKVGGIPEIVRNPEEGILFDGSKIDDMEDSITKLLVNPELRYALSAAGLVRARDFDKRRMIEKLRTLYFEIEAGVL